MLTIDARLEIFKKNFPQEKIKSVQEREGQDYSILEINHTWMCKSAKTQDGVAALEREVKLLGMLEDKITTNVPQPLYYEENFLVYKKIAGSPLFSYMINHLGNRQRAKLITDVARFLVELHHALSPEQAQELGLQATDWPWSVEKLQAHRVLLEGKAEILEIFDSVIEICQDSQDAKDLALIHNDFHVKNIIVDPLTGQLRGIIDFTHIAFDDSALDLRMRRQTPLDFVKAVALAYTMQGGKRCSAEKLYGYYFATEFSRYFEICQHENKEQAETILHEIVRVVQSLAGKHEECKKTGTCVHAQQRSVPTTMLQAE